MRRLKPQQTGVFEKFQREDFQQPPTPVPTTHVEKVVVPYDPLNEASVIALAAQSQETLDRLLLTIRPEHFKTRECREAWEAMAEVRRKRLDLDPAAVRAVSTDKIAFFIEDVATTGAPKNLDYHVQGLLWDHARVVTAKGPLQAFLDGIRDPKMEAERLRALAKQVMLSLQGTGERPHLIDQAALVRHAMVDVEERLHGRATYSYGVPGIDKHPDGTQRMIPGSAPGLMTVLTANSGGGKSTLVQNMMLGMAFENGCFEKDAPGRSILAGAWEMQAQTTLESLAEMSLRWSRSDARVGKGALTEHDNRVLLRERMKLIAERIRFLELPFARTSGERKTGANDRNLDLIHAYIADSGCEVFVADLWERCLRETNPDDVTQALYRQQAMLQETRVHGILLHQLRFKDVEARSDPRPTRESLKGSGAYIEVADAVLGIHWPYLYKNVDPNTIEVILLKQRYGKWPMALELSYDPDSGAVWGGRDVQYQRPGESSEVEAGLADSWKQGGGGGRKFRGR